MVIIAYGQFTCIYPVHPTSFDHRTLSFIGSHCGIVSKSPKAFNICNSIQKENKKDLAIIDFGLKVPLFINVYN
jgi:hypothetical protein